MKKTYTRFFEDCPNCSTTDSFAVEVTMSEAKPDPKFKRTKLRKILAWEGECIKCKHTETLGPEDFREWKEGEDGWKLE